MVLHRIKLDTISDEPYIELYPKLASFFETEKGNWILARSQITVEHETGYDVYNMQYYTEVKGQLSEEDTLWFHLKWGNANV